MTKVNNGIDYVALAIGGGGDNGQTGTSTAVATTTMTNTGAAFTASSGGPPETGGLSGHVVVTGGVYGNIVKNSTTVLTIDYWHSATVPGTVASNPATGTYNVIPGGTPAWYMALSTANRAIAAADAFLTNDGSTVSEIWNSGGALNRAKGTYAHTLGTATYTLSTGNLTTNANDPNPVTVRRVGVFVHGVTAAPTTTTTGLLLFETDISNAPTLVQGDTINVTDTVTIS